ncbi:hypothetical protein [Nostoc sp.]|uniref:hypothetical protein n=1 Tax=Nostoc sp. TaxID=1180 RepID=UPI002FF9E474
MIDALLCKIVKPIILAHCVWNGFLFKRSLVDLHFFCRAIALTIASFNRGKPLEESIFYRKIKLVAQREISWR